MSAGVVAMVVADVVAAVVDRACGRDTPRRALGDALLTRCARCDGGDAGGAKRAPDDAADLERAARCAGDGPEQGDAVPVAEELALPRDAVPVLVDLELDLDTSVFAAELQVARRLLGARSLDADGAVMASPRECGRDCDERDGEEHEGDEDGGAGHLKSPLVGLRDCGQSRRAPVRTAMRHWSEFPRN